MSAPCLTNQGFAVLASHISFAAHSRTGGVGGCWYEAVLFMTWSGPSFCCITYSPVTVHDLGKLLVGEPGSKYLLSTSSISSLLVSQQKGPRDLGDIPAPKGTVNLKNTFMHEEAWWQAGRDVERAQALKICSQVPYSLLFLSRRGERNTVRRGKEAVGVGPPL